MTLRGDGLLPLRAHPSSLHQVQVSDCSVLHRTLACMGMLQPKLPLEGASSLQAHAGAATAYPHPTKDAACTKAAEHCTYPSLS